YSCGPARRNQLFGALVLARCLLSVRLHYTKLIWDLWSTLHKVAHFLWRANVLSRPYIFLPMKKGVKVVLFCVLPPPVDGSPVGHDEPPRQGEFRLNMSFRLLGNFALDISGTEFARGRNCTYDTIHVLPVYRLCDC